MPKIDLGKVVGDGGVKIAVLEVTLLAGGWSSSAQTVAAAGVTADKMTCHVSVSPDPGDHDAYAECGVRCTGQAENALTFGAITEPDADLLVNVMILK